jgi:hypothetical protein
LTNYNTKIWFNISSLKSNRFNWWYW